MQAFVNPHSIVREIWGTGDTILFIFAGAAAEFSVNKAVDWLYFTGRLPKDPLGRLFSTVGYARTIVFSDREGAHRAIDAMAHIHAAVEEKRGKQIPDWAYRDVLFMLIDYSIRAYEVLERRLTKAEKTEVFEVFNRVGIRMGVRGLPATYREWTEMRHSHLRDDLVYSAYTEDLYRQYRKHLGWARYLMLREGQMLVVPERVRRLLRFRKFSLLYPVIGGYKLARWLGVHTLMRDLILPTAYKAEIKSLDRRSPDPLSEPRWSVRMDGQRSR
ncbi:oxygenase MpaB family protein [Lewinella sp. IMCC34191]|uniref:oxygenase MpaB family protein n=1 Tax=Lewinella sp. IMCC34191 TaxID=2259172 RepID=UPI000E228689|nr:oxygenase MpaB family protein [Lewinella sp. IMCC34191]